MPFAHSIAVGLATKLQAKFTFAAVSGVEKQWLLYHFPVHPLAQKLLVSIRKQRSIRAGDRLAVAVSGGADSVALLRLLIDLRDEIGIVLSVAHVNHKLRGQESEADAEFVKQLSAVYSLQLQLRDAPVVAPNIEASARAQRYNFFRELARDGQVAKIATAHTLDDQAETVLLRAFRGTGIRGLAGIHPRVVFELEGRPFGEVVRPLLGFRRAALKDFLVDLGQSWREDSSNSNVAFDRNRVRHRLLPLIHSEFGDAAIEHLSELAEIARGEEEHWKAVHPEVTPSISSGLAIEPLMALPIAAQRRLMREWLATNAPEVSISFRVIEQALLFGLGKKSQQPTLQLSALWTLRLDDGRLHLERNVARSEENYAYALAVPGATAVPELALRFEASEVEVQSVPEKLRRTLLNQALLDPALLNPDQTLHNPALLPKQLLIRNWKVGERYWPANTSSPKKIKDLLTDRKIKGEEKRLWPVVESAEGAIVWMRGFAAPAEFQVPEGATKAIWIREFPVSS